MTKENPTGGQPVKGKTMNVYPTNEETTAARLAALRVLHLWEDAPEAAYRFLETGSGFQEAEQAITASLARKSLYGLPAAVYAGMVKARRTVYSASAAACAAQACACAIHAAKAIDTSVLRHMTWGANVEAEQAEAHAHRH